MINFTIREKTIMFLFTRWISLCYSDHLNDKNGPWYFEMMEYFEVMVLPNMIENGSFDATVDYLLEQNKK